MKNTTIYFSECEHSVDLENYLDDIRSSGGIITCKQLNAEEETAKVDILFDDTFADKFRKTNAFQFSNFSK